MNAVMNIVAQLIAGHFMTGCEPVNLSRRTLLHGLSNIMVTKIGSIAD